MACSSASLHVPKSFRLLRLDVESIGASQLRYKLETHMIAASSCPAYKALSYTWGSAAFAPGDVESPDMKHTIECNSIPVIVTQNLYDALCQFAKSQPEAYLWIDAVCIDQANIEEVDSQVQLMGDIYSGASEVLVWLGKDTKDLDDFRWVHEQNLLLECAWDLLREMKLMEVRQLLFPVDGTSDYQKLLISKWRGYWKFFDRRRYFSRAWIVQELCLAKTATVWCGTEKMEWKQIDVLAQLLSVSGMIGLLSRYTDPDFPDSSPQKAFKIGFLRTECSNGGPEHADREVYFEKYPAINGNPSAELRYFEFFERALNLIRDHQATDPRDKVFSILGLLNKFLLPGMEPPIRPDYASPVESIYTSTAYLFLQKLPGLVMLSTVEDRSKRRLTNLPSWVPDFSYCSGSFSGLNALTTSCKYNACGNSEGFRYSISRSGKTLNLDGAVFDTVEEASCAPLPVHAIYEWKGPTWFEYLESLLRVTCNLSPVYATGERRHEVLWRTLIANAVNAELATKDLDESFRCWIIYMITMPVSLGCVGDTATLSALLDHLTELGRSSGDVEWLILQNDLADIVRNIFSDEANRDPTYNDVIAAIKSKSTAFNMAYSACKTDRGIYRTRKGFLGLGPASLQVGDQVWMICGARLPMIFRPRPNRHNFEFMGDSYLHGFMNGEMLNGEWSVQDKIRSVDLD